MWTSRVSKQGQASIPKELRKLLNIEEGDIVAFTQKDGNIIIQKATVVVENK
ncbi:AbrB/MazE/SpoVT family DNA-binding domain-containing protein [Thermoactinomyces sp. DSM 45892]|uniref:AbrB/MazE/SpoVT family DNA-binding domain-containing protein n=1 Tax=Thermoactinomyces sp. DSM 45892 TaxID=1882753 RepID=UPI0008953CC7|nr:AbrB/MazE/SpoVT family DNA-binding domain-containing protein [Thermoactinomyces sp. DSM 45892]SDY84242.1 looped-hinge helix DNA binding domain-containing protein, AbrB family [Thermoactinomyces sp. DSM 45892]